MEVKTDFLCYILICRNLCLKLQKYDKGDGTRQNQHYRVSSTSNIIFGYFR